jgi:hypothetical protein
MSEEPKHTVLLPPNDPARLCWKFLGDVLERAEVPPADPAAARDRLRALLLEAYQTRGYKLLRMALLGSGTGSMRGRIEAFVQSLRAHGIEIDTRMSSVPDADDVRTLLADPGWRSATNYILTRWWSMGDGRKTLARVAAYRVLDASTNEPIKAWLPERCGVVPYLRERTRHILLAYYDETEHRLPTVSLDYISDVHKLELSSEGRFERPFRLGSDEDAGEPPEEAQAREGAPDDDEVRRVQDEIYASTPAARHPDPAAEAEAQAREQIDALIERYRGRAEAPAPDTYGCWPLCVFDPQFTADLAGDGERVRRSAQALIARLAGLKDDAGRPLDADIAADQGTLEQLLNDWNGQTPLVEYLPELADSALTHRYALGSGEIRRETRDPGGVPTAPTPEEEAVIAGVQLLLIAPEDRRNVLERIEDLAANPAMGKSQALGFDQVTLQELLALREADVDLNSPQRLDYLFLLGYTLRSPDYALEGAPLHEELRLLFREFLDRNVERLPGLREIVDDICTWNPAERLLGEVLLRAGKFLAARCGRLEEEPAAAATAVVADAPGQARMTFE